MTKETCSEGHEKHPRPDWRYMNLCEEHNLREAHATCGTPIGQGCVALNSAITTEPALSETGGGVTLGSETFECDCCEHEYYVDDGAICEQCFLTSSLAKRNKKQLLRVEVLETELLSARKVLSHLGIEGEPCHENVVWDDEFIARFDAHQAQFPEEG